MNETALISLIALLGWLVLAVGAFRSYRVGGRKMVTLGLTWAAIFVAVALVFHVVGR